MFILIHLKKSFQNFLYLDFKESGPYKAAEKVDKGENQKGIEHQYTSESIIKSTLDKKNKGPVGKEIKKVLSRDPKVKELKEKYTLEKIMNSPEKLEGNFSRERILKENLDHRIEKTLPKGQNIDKIAKILKKPDGSNFKSLEEAKNFLREQFLKGEIKKLDEPPKDKDGKPLYDKEGKIIDKPKYKLILDKNPELAKLNNDKNPEFAKELIAVYGEKELSDIGPILEQLKKEGLNFPRNLEEFDKVINKLKDKNLKTNLTIEEDGEVIPDKKTIREFSRNMSLSTLSKYSRVATNMDIPGSISGNEIPRGNLDDSRGRDVINNLPEGKIKNGLLEAASYVGKGRNDPDLIKYTARGGRPSNERYYCKAFLNSAVMSMGYNIGKSALSMDALKAGQPIDPKEALPGDIIVLSRNGTDTAGNPGSHTGIFLGWGKEGPIILSGNSTGGRVTIKEYRGRTIYGVRRVMSTDEANAIKNNSKKIT